MSGLVKMWISLGGIVLMFLSIVFIYLGREKLSGLLKVFVTFFAYMFMIMAGLIMVFTVFSSP